MKETIIVICCFTILITMIFIVKDFNTLAQRNKIRNAIREYRIRCFINDSELKVMFEDLEPYDKTLFRIWDWRCSRILPIDKYELIKDYINHTRETENEDNIVEGKK